MVDRIMVGFSLDEYGKVIMNNCWFGADKPVCAYDDGEGGCDLKRNTRAKTADTKCVGHNCASCQSECPNFELSEQLLRKWWVIDMNGGTKPVVVFKSGE